MNAKDLVSYTTPPVSVSDTDIVIWYRRSVHPHPRDEDGEKVGGVRHGVAVVMWTGFMLKPHNLFDRTQLCERAASNFASSNDHIPLFGKDYSGLDERSGG